MASRIALQGLKALAALSCCLLAACRTVPGPERAVEDYARALQEDRLDDAYALTSSDSRARTNREAFLARYEDPKKRAERAEALLAAAASLHACGTGVEAVREGEQWLVRELPAEEGARQALAQFLDVAEKGDFAAAYRLLSASWRSRYTPERLGRDFGLEPLARERLARARAALGGPVVLEQGAARFPLGEGKAVRLVREGGAYRVTALE